MCANKGSTVRLVLDTNIVVSALLWAGVPRRLLELGRDNTVTLFSSPALLDELADVLARKKFV
ncbi:MAG: putative toxin-antitoxin system toxin component, PIN family [Gammaproteobacteria bacterium]